MQLYDDVTGPNGQNLPRLSKNLDLSSEETAAVVRSVLPELRRNLERRTLSRGGLADIIKSLGDAQQEAFLNPDTDLASKPAINHGNDLLGEILETKYQSRAVADRAERETGVSAAKIREMLPRIANVSMGALSRQARPGLEDIFKRLPSFPGNKGDVGPRSTNPSSVNGSPLPLPGDNWGGGSRNNYDDLSDVLTRRQRPLQSNPLWDVVRNVIGGAFGFQSKGILSYIIRFVIARYGWTILRMVFGRFVRG